MIRIYDNNAVIHTNHCRLQDIFLFKISTDTRKNFFEMFGQAPHKKVRHPWSRERTDASMREMSALTLVRIQPRLL